MELLSLVPTLADIDDVAGFDGELILAIAGDLLGVHLEGAEGIPLLPLHNDMSPVGDPGESTRHGDRFEQAEILPTGEFIGAGTLNLSDDVKFA